MRKFPAQSSDAASTNMEDKAVLSNLETESEYVVPDSLKIFWAGSSELHKTIYFDVVSVKYVVLLVFNANLNTHPYDYCVHWKDPKRRYKNH